MRNLFFLAALVLAVSSLKACNRVLQDGQDSELSNIHDNVAQNLWNSYGDASASAIRQTVKLEIFIDGTSEKVLVFSGSGMIIDKNSIITSAEGLTELTSYFQYSDDLVPIEFQLALSQLRGSIKISDYMGDEVVTFDVKISDILTEQDQRIQFSSAVSYEDISEGYLDENRGKNIALIRMPEVDLEKTLGATLHKVELDPNIIPRTGTVTYTLGYGRNSELFQVGARKIDENSTLFIGINGRNKNVYARLPLPVPSPGFVSSDVGGPLLKFENGKIKLVGIVNGTEVFDNGSFLSQFLGGGKYKAELFTSLGEPEVQQFLRKNNFTLLEKLDCPPQ